MTTTGPEDLRAQMQGGIPPISDDKFVPDSDLQTVSAAKLFLELDLLADYSN